jgi:hypothetical protein
VTQIMKENSKKWCLTRDNNLMLLTETRLGLFDPKLVTYKRTTVSIRDNLDWLKSFESDKSYRWVQMHLYERVNL